MDISNKGKSPFYPGQPVPIEFFIGRLNEVSKISRAVGQVALGKPQAIFLTGEYGIGKSSLAGFMKFLAEKDGHLLGIHVFLGGAETVEDVATRTVEAAVKAQLYEPTVSEKVRNILARYVGKQDILGLSVNLDALKADGPTLTRGFLPFLGDLVTRLKDDGVKGVVLILDEINGITKNPQFSHFIKTLVDENGTSKNPVPLLLILCGVEERRVQMIEHHQPIDRIFDIVEIAPLTVEEMRDFFNRTFNSTGMAVTPEAMTELCHYSAGFPRIMHLIGENVFWRDSDGVIDREDAMTGVILSAEDVGRKFVDAQVYRALKSQDYRSILTKLSTAKFDLKFKRSEIENGLSATERKKFNNFLQKMKELAVLKSGEGRGEYVFTNRMVRLYLMLHELENNPGAPQA